MGVKCKFTGDDDVQCQTYAIYGIEKNKPISCKRHKTEEQSDVLNKMCEKCNSKQATYGLEKKKGRWCKTCKEPGSFDVKHKMCEFETCLT